MHTQTVYGVISLEAEDEYRGNAEEIPGRCLDTGLAHFQNIQQSPRFVTVSGHDMGRVLAGTTAKCCSHIETLNWMIYRISVGSRVTYQICKEWQY